jgi:hypothetical protein
VSAEKHATHPSDGPPIDMDAVVQKAEDAFWAAIADGCREYTDTGDLSPDTAVKFEINCRSAGFEWAVNNVEGEYVQTKCGALVDTPLGEGKRLCAQPIRFVGRGAPGGGWWKHEDHPADDHEATWSGMRIDA